MEESRVINQKKNVRLDVFSFAPNISMFMTR